MTLRDRAAALDPRLVLAFGTVVASVATAGSLYLSLGLGLVPCELCWYQRILMYPLVVVLGVAAWDGRVGVWQTVAPLALLGAGIATYHSVLQRVSTTCSFDGPVSCAAIQYTVGPLSVPNLALVAFVLVLASLAVANVAAAGPARGDRLG